MSSQLAKVVEAEKIVVAMSGGVDSSAAAMLLHEQGFFVIGVSMQVWDYRKNGGASSRATCCAPSDFNDARSIATTSGFPYYVFDFEDSFQEEVITPFVNEYLRGRTPNPCVECNRKIKFQQLRKRASSFGVETIATGHYARVRKNSDGSAALFTARDETKDQSYFLYSMTQNDLQHTMFPVGEMTKPEVRNYLHSKGLSLSEKKESYDICFVSSSVGEFVKKHTSEDKAGDIVLKDGTKLGSHRGYYQYTIGQRKGLGLSAKNPLYVLRIDAETAEVEVGEKKDLEKASFVVRDVNWISGKTPQEPFTALVKLRYRNAGVRCRIEPRDSETIEAFFLDNWTAVSPGQAAVFYSEQAGKEELRELFGGGVIAYAEHHA